MTSKTTDGTPPSDDDNLAQIAARRASEGKDIVEAFTTSAASAGTDRGYAAWVGLDVSDLSKISDPTARREALAQMAANTKAIDYRLALAAHWPEISQEVARVATRIAAQSALANDSVPAATQETPTGASGTDEIPKAFTSEPLQRQPEQPVANAGDTVVANDSQVGHPANDASARVKPTMELGEDALARVRRAREADRAAALASLDDARAPAQSTAVPASAADLENTLEAPIPPAPEALGDTTPSASVRAPILTANGYALPAAVAARYRVQDGHFWSTSPASSPSRSYKGARETQGATARPKAAFIDQGPRLATRDHDRTTVADMVAVARAKHWATITLRGTEEFRRHAWLEASLAGLKVKGFTPSPHDLAMLQGAKRDSEALRITPAAAQPAMTTPTAPPVQPVRIPVEPIASTPPLAPTGMASLAAATAQTATSEATSKTAAVHIKAVRQAFEQTIAGYPEATRRELTTRFDTRLRESADIQRRGGERQVMRQAVNARFAELDVKWNAPPEEEKNTSTPQPTPKQPSPRR